MNQKTSLVSVLLIDDDETGNIINKIFIKQLKLGVKVYTSSNGKDGLEAILAKGEHQLPLPCMVMLDIHMPIMNGWKFVEEYQKRVPQKIKDQIVIVLVTTSDNEYDRELAAQTPFIKDYVNKPLSDVMFRELIAGNFSLEET